MLALNLRRFGLARAVSAPLRSARGLSSAVDSSNERSREAPPKHEPEALDEEAIRRLDEEQARIAEQKREQAEERRLEALGKIVRRSDKPRVPEAIAPWQKVWFPNERVVLIKPETLDVTATDLVFRVPPKMTKHEIQDYLEAVYGFDVKKVTTVNRMGKIKYPAGYSLVPNKAYKRPDFKQAYVKLNTPDYRPQPSNHIVRDAPAAKSS